MKNYLSLALVCILLGCSNQKKNEEEGVIYISDLSEIDTSNVVIMTDEEGNILYQKEDFDEAEFVLMSGINDSIFYQYKKDSLGKRYVDKMFKYEYHRESFQIDIKDDSIQLGDEFIGYIAFAMDENNKAIVYGGDEDIVITQDDFEQDSSSNFQPYMYRIIAKDTGVKEFKGKIFIGSEEYPFAYRYVVVPKDNRSQDL